MADVRTAGSAHKINLRPPSDTSVADLKNGTLYNEQECNNMPDVSILISSIKGLQRLRKQLTAIISARKRRTAELEQSIVAVTNELYNISSSTFTKTMKKISQKFDSQIALLSELSPTADQTFTDFDQLVHFRRLVSQIDYIPMEPLLKLKVSATSIKNQVSKMAETLTMVSNRKLIGYKISGAYKTIPFNVQSFQLLISKDGKRNGISSWTDSYLLKVEQVTSFEESKSEPILENENLQKKKAVQTPPVDISRPFENEDSALPVSANSAPQRQLTSSLKSTEVGENREINAADDTGLVNESRFSVAELILFYSSEKGGSIVDQKSEVKPFELRVEIDSRNVNCNESDCGTVDDDELERMQSSRQNSIPILTVSEISKEIVEETPNHVNKLEIRPKTKSTDRNYKQFSCRNTDHKELDDKQILVPRSHTSRFSKKSVLKIPKSIENNKIHSDSVKECHDSNKIKNYSANSSIPLNSTGCRKYDSAASVISRREGRKHIRKRSIPKRSKFYSDCESDGENQGHIIHIKTSKLLIPQRSDSLLMSMLNTSNQFPKCRLMHSTRTVISITDSDCDSDSEFQLNSTDSFSTSKIYSSGCFKDSAHSSSYSQYNSNNSNGESDVDSMMS